jgi:hypothetical protein
LRLSAARVTPVAAPSWTDDLRAGARFLVRLPVFLRYPWSPASAATILRRRLAFREADFLSLARRRIYQHPGSPYREMLRLAGCELGDMEHLVRQEGLEGALRLLYRQGVYLTVEELKGRRPIVRGGATLAWDPAGLRNPESAARFAAQTSGSRGPRAPVVLDLAFLADLAVNRGLALAARSGRDWKVAYWDVPGGGLAAILVSAKAGAPAVRWFSPVDPDLPGVHPRYRWSARLARWASLAAGRGLPAARHVSVANPLPIAQWMASVLEQGETPFLTTYSSPAVRLCQAAQAAGIRLQGARIALYGEPITGARATVIRKIGAEVIPVYVTMESGRVGDGCLAPEAADEVHLFHDFHAVIQPGPADAQPGLPAGALLLTSLRTTAPLMLLNASMGDQAVVSERACGCALEALGWKTHLHTIRSYEKLTVGGMTFLDVDVVRVLEQVLPERFGGAPTDYQLVEGSAERGHPRVRLLVHPAVGALDAEAVRYAFIGALGVGSGTERIMTTVWGDADVLRVERRAPIVTATGKILHLHLDQGREAPG